MKLQIAQWLISALKLEAETAAVDLQALNISEETVVFTPTKDPIHGDIATNLAMIVARHFRSSPKDLATKLVASINASHPDNRIIEKIEVAGPGFINFFLKKNLRVEIIKTVLEKKSEFGKKPSKNPETILLEFVSANPTGPLHVGHGRGAAYGSTLANVLRAAGHTVHCEYYVNDAGRQMDILALSVWVRYLQKLDISCPIPQNAYQGEYIFDISQQAIEKFGRDWVRPLNSLPKAQDESGIFSDEELDIWISECKKLLGDSYSNLHSLGLNDILKDIQQDLTEFGVTYESWFSEQSLSLNNPSAIDESIAFLKNNGHLYEKEGALWFRSTSLGDDKDRVVIRENGQPTYFASDIAYHWQKFQRGFDRLINIWGADHHGYIPRVKAALIALGADAEKLEVLLVQFAVLYRSGKKVQMSTRSGSFVTLRELRAEVGNDAARFFYAMRKPDQHLDFDLDLATSQSKDNPIFYVHYAHARLCSVFAKYELLHGATFEYSSISNIQLLQTEEIDLCKLIEEFPEIIQRAADQRAPHVLIQYLRDLASSVHRYYNEYRIIDEDSEITNNRLLLCAALRIVLSNGLGILGLSAPEKM